MHHDAISSPAGSGYQRGLNLLARRGIASQASAPSPRYRHRTAPIGLKVDVTNVAEVLDRLDDDR